MCELFPMPQHIFAPPRYSISRTHPPGRRGLQGHRLRSRRGLSGRDDRAAGGDEILSGWLELGERTPGGLTGGGDLASCTN